MSNDNPNTPKTPKGYQPPRQGKPGEERKPSLNRSIGGASNKAPKQEPSIQPKGLPQGARPTGVEAYGSSNWRAPTHRPQRPQQAAKPPSPSLFERFPILQQWKDKLVALWRQRFPKKTEEDAQPSEESPEKFAETKAKAAALRASWGEKLTATKEKVGTKSSELFGRMGTWWGNAWSNTKEKLGPPLGRLREKIGQGASVASARVGQGISVVFEKLGVWSNKGADLAQRTAQNVKEKMPELPPASEVMRKLPGVNAGLEAMDAARSKRAQAAITSILAQTFQSLAAQGVETAAALQAEPCGGEFIEARMTSGDAAAWLDEANDTNAPMLPPVLFHRPSDAMRLLAARQRLIQEHPMLWQEGLLQPVMALGFVIHASRVPAHLLELVIVYLANIIAIQLDDPDGYQSFLWYTKQAAQVVSKEDSSRVARQVLAARSSGTISQEMNTHIVAGLGQLT